MSLKDFKTTFLEGCDPMKKIINIERLNNIDGQKFGWNKKLKTGMEDVFDDIGFSWKGHQLYTMWVCYYKEKHDGRDKKIYVHSLELAKQLAIKYSANSIVLTEKGFSLRWGYEVIRNPSDNISKKTCGATGMGVWLNNTINVDPIKQFQIIGVKVSPKLIKKLEKVKTNELIEEDIEGEIILL